MLRTVGFLKRQAEFGPVCSIRRARAPKRNPPRGGGNQGKQIWEAATRNNFLFLQSILGCPFQVMRTARPWTVLAAAKEVSWSIQ